MSAKLNFQNRKRFSTALNLNKMDFQKYREPKFNSKEMKKISFIYKKN